MKPITVGSLSGGKTSSFMAENYPADLNIFACVCIDYPRAKPKDPAVLKYALDKLNGNFIASAESEKTLVVMMKLEQLLGKNIVWVRGKSFDEVIDGAGCLPTWARRFCTTDMKLLPIFEYVYFKYGFVKENIGFRYDEAHRAYKNEWLNGFSVLEHQKHENLFGESTHGIVPPPVKTWFRKSNGKIQYQRQVNAMHLSSVERSKISPLIANAMADQWG